MNNVDVVSTVFQAIIDRKPDFSEFNDRLEVQKIVYILTEIGVTCGDYSFRWYKHGPYSQELQNVMLFEQPSGEKLELSNAGLAAISKIKTMFYTQHLGYSDSVWLETLGSLLYLNKHYYKSASGDYLSEQLRSLKNHLENDEINKKAVGLLKSYALLSE